MNNARNILQLSSSAIHQNVKYIWKKKTSTNYKLWWWIDYVQHGCNIMYYLTWNGPIRLLKRRLIKLISHEPRFQNKVDKYIYIFLSTLFWCFRQYQCSTVCHIMLSTSVTLNYCLLDPRHKSLYICTLCTSYVADSAHTTQTQTLRISTTSCKFTAFILGLSSVGGVIVFRPRARWRGVLPSSVVMLRLAPNPMRRSTALTWPSWTAMCKAVSLVFVRALMSHCGCKGLIY